MSDDTRKDERRRNLGLRSVIDEAYDRISPFLDPDLTWGGMPLERLAYRMLRDNYPDLSTGEVRALIIASVRVYRARNPEQAAHLPRPEEKLISPVHDVGWAIPLKGARNSKFQHLLIYEKFRKTLP
jgi:hypothetical protein